MIRLVLALCVLTAPALADEATTPKILPDKETVSVQAWGAVHPDCVEWTDSCIVCTKAGCSTPGIACTPVEPMCRRP